MRRYVWLLILPLLGCTPKPAPTPPPPPDPSASCCNVPPADAEGWSVVSPKPDPYNIAFMVEAEQTIGDVCGSEPDYSLQRLAAQMVATRYVCAAQWTNREGTKIDAIVVLRPDGLWEEMHSVAYSTGCWTQPENAYKNAWKGPSMLGCP